MAHTKVFKKEKECFDKILNQKMRMIYNLQSFSSRQSREKSYHYHCKKNKKDRNVLVKKSRLRRLEYQMNFLVLQKHFN